MAPTKPRALGTAWELKQPMALPWQCPIVKRFPQFSQIHTFPIRSSKTQGKTVSCKLARKMVSPPNYGHLRQSLHVGRIQKSRYLQKNKMGSTEQKINKSVIKHTRSFPVPYKQISRSCQKDNLPPNTGHRRNLAFGSSILIPTLVPECQLLNESYYNTVTELESPQPSKSLPSAGFIKPHTESTLHAIFISTVLEETWITTTQPTALQTLKIMMKVVNPM